MHDSEARKYAEEAAELILRKGFELPSLKEVRIKKTRIGITAAQYYAPPSFEHGMGRIEVNIHPDVQRWAGGYAMSEGWGTQPNIILHEFGHMLDHYLEHLYPKSVKEQIHDRFDDLKEEEVKKNLSKYGATQAVEFRAEVIAGILSGKSFPKEFLKAAYLDNYLKDERGNLIYQMGSGEIPNTSMVEKQFGNMMEALFNEKGASLKIELLGHPEVSKFIESHAQVLENPFQQTEVSDLMRTRLQESAYIFSGFKTFHELGEAFPSLMDEKGHKKPFNQFLNDVQKIDQTYNKRYLQAEYNFASASSDMAGRWEQFVKDEDEYYLQYRTANDGAVRPEHAALHDVTLPASDSFWDSYYPPNGWNCRCTVIQVLRYMHEATPHDEAMQRGSQALAKDKKGMFNFNPGKQQKLFPDYNPYSISKCRECSKAELKLYAGDPDNPLCQACSFIKQCYVEKRTEIPNGKGVIKINELVDRKSSDYQKLYQIAEHFSKDGATVELTPKMSRPAQFLYDCIYGDLKGTKFYGKCPDMRINGVWYEHEGIVTGWGKHAFSNMLNRGLKQSNHLVIDDCGLTDRWMKKSLYNRIQQGQDIKEVWVRAVDGIRLLYKKQEE